MRPLARLLAGAAVALFLALPGVSGAEVLCIGSDGHVRLEDAARADCQEREERPLGALARGTAERAGGTAEGRGPECGPCTDLSVESLLRALSKGSGAAAPPPPMGLALAFASPSSRPARPVAPARPVGARSASSSRGLSQLGVFRC